MNKPDSFEEKLQQQTLRQVPAGWRAEILTAVTETREGRTGVESLESSNIAAANAQIEKTTPNNRGGEGWNQWLANILWPHPIAWSGLAATWLVILGLNMASSDRGEPKIARDTTPPSPQMRELLREQEQMFAELIGPVDTPTAAEPRRRGAQPRSEVMRVEWLNG